MFKLPPPNAEEFGEYLKAARIKKKLSQAQLAQKCGLNAAMPSRYERGQHSPSQRVWEALNRVLFEEDSPRHDKSDEILLSDASIDQLVQALKTLGATTVAVTF